MEKRTESIQWISQPGTDPVALEAMLQAVLREGHAPNLKHGRRKELYHVRGSNGVQTYLLKVNRYAGTSYWRHLRTSKAHREFARAQAAAARGIPTPLPLAAGEQRCHGALTACYLFTPYLPEARDLRALQRENKLLAAARHAAVRHLGQLTHRLVESGVFQEDFAPNNILWCGSNETLQLIDFERVRILRRPLRFRETRWMIGKLLRELPDISASERMRFLLAFCNGDRTAARRWWRELEAFAPKLARRDLRRMRRAATSPGRRFFPIAVVDWKGYARRGACSDVLEKLLPESEKTAPEKVLVENQWFWVLHAGGLRRCAALALWSAANTLYERGLAPRPVALLRRKRETLYVAESRPESEVLDAEVARRLRTTLAVFLRRLRLTGQWSEEMPPHALVFELPAKTAKTLRLLDPRWLKIAGRAGPPRTLPHLLR